MLIADMVDSDASGVLMLHLLGRCNLRCVHCYMDGAPDRSEQLRVEHVLGAIHECATLGIASLYVTGGEPLLYPEIEEVLEAGTGIDGLRTTLCTNATRLTERKAIWLGRLGIDLNISIDGDAGYHDAFRKHKGAFAAAERGVDRAVAAGCNVTVVSTITRRNLQMLPRLVEWAIGHGVRTFRAQPLLKLGRGETISEDRLTSEEVDLLILKMSDLANRHRQYLHCSIVGQSRRFLLAHPCAAYVCNGGGCHRRIEKEIKKIVVREDGTVLPECTNLHQSYRIGQLGDAPLAEMVEHYLDHGYSRFDRLCRTAYADMVSDWPMSVVPWDQIVAERSRSDLPAAPLPHTLGCGRRSGSLGADARGMALH